MAAKYIFINNAINDAIVMYAKYKDKDTMVQSHSFMVEVIRMLGLIYNIEDIIEAYCDKDTSKFESLLMQYGYPEAELKSFEENFLLFYKFDFGQKDRAIRKKNRYFNLVQKSIIDMMIAKNNTSKIDLDSVDNLYKMLFTANSEDFYKKSYALSTAYNPYEIDDYFKKNCS